MSDTYSKPGLPSPELQLLLQCYACPIDQATEAWWRWWETRTIDDATWAEVRLLAAVATRSPNLPEPAGQVGRLKGIRRYVWYSNQNRLHQGLPVIDLFNASDIPVMLLKGGARLTVDPMSAASRYMRDLDLFLPSERLADGNRLLLANGFRPTLGKLPGRVRAAAFDPVDTGFGTDKVNPCELDIHCAVLRFGRSGDFDETLWQRARQCTLRGRPVYVPSPSDMFIHAVAHGVVADVEAPADWAIDALAAAREPTFDWDLVLKESNRRSLDVAMSYGVSYLADTLGLDVPKQISVGLQRGARSWLFRREYLADARPRNLRRVSDRVIAGLAEMYRSNGSRRNKLGPMTTVSGRPIWPRRGVPNDAMPLASNFSLSGQTCPSSGILHLDLYLEHPPRRRVSFDILLDGRWIGRLRLRPILGLKHLSSRAWRVRLPLRQLTRACGAGIAGDLTIVPLGNDMKPLGPSGDLPSARFHPTA